MSSKFLAGLVKMIEQVEASQDGALDAAAAAMADALQKRQLVHLFGSGHSVIPTLDAFPRYGSFVGLHPLNDPRLMWHNVMGPGGVRELLWLEREEGYIQQYLSHEALRKGDVLVVFSHGGRNAAPVEAALYAKERGLFVIAVTSKVNLDRPASHSSGLRIGEIAHVTVDTCSPVEDAIVKVDGWDRPVGGSSTIVATAVMQELIARTAQKLADRGVSLPTFVSPTVPGASLASNDEVFTAHEELLAEAQDGFLKARRAAKG